MDEESGLATPSLAQPLDALTTSPTPAPTPFSANLDADVHPVRGVTFLFSDSAEEKPAPPALPTRAGQPLPFPPPNHVSHSSAAAMPSYSPAGPSELGATVTSTASSGAVTMVAHSWHHWYSSWGHPHHTPELRLDTTGMLCVIGCSVGVAPIGWVLGRGGRSLELMRRSGVGW
eukprot:RCo026867